MLEPSWERKLNLAPGNNFRELAWSVLSGVHCGVLWRTRTLGILLCHTSSPLQSETQCFAYMTSLCLAELVVMNLPGLAEAGGRFAQGQEALNPLEGWKMGSVTA